MAEAAILGAGYMGSALSFPLAENRNGVRLWGTWLDDEIIDAAAHGSHPKLGLALPPKVRLFHSEGLSEAVAGADFCVIAVSSDGFLAVLERLLGVLEKPCPLVTVTKGFVRLGGEVCRVSEAGRSLLERRFGADGFRWASVGGPVKAVELARHVPTATIFALDSRKLHDLIGCFKTRYYRVETTDDTTGVELCSAFKNIYSVALGIHDGLYGGLPDRLFHNFKSLLFNQAVREMAAVVEASGGRRQTAYDLAGAGDLLVTSSSGRNRRFGEYVGKGVPAVQAYELMRKEGELAEGYHTAAHGFSYMARVGAPLLEKLPLLTMLYGIVVEGHGVQAEIERFLDVYMGP